MGLIFCRPSISFAIAARWEEVTLTRPHGEDPVVLPVTWPTHGELKFTVSKRLAGNVFRRWLQLRMQTERLARKDKADRFTKVELDNGARPDDWEVVTKVEQADRPPSPRSSDDGRPDRRDRGSSAKRRRQNHAGMAKRRLRRDGSTVSMPPGLSDGGPNGARPRTGTGRPGPMGAPPPERAVPVGKASLSAPAPPTMPDQRSDDVTAELANPTPPRPPRRVASPLAEVTETVAMERSPAPSTSLGTSEPPGDVRIEIDEVEQSETLGASDDLDLRADVEAAADDTRLRDGDGDLTNELDLDNGQPVHVNPGPDVAPDITVMAGSVDLASTETIADDPTEWPPAVEHRATPADEHTIGADLDISHNLGARELDARREREARRELDAYLDEAYSSTLGELDGPVIDLTADLSIETEAERTDVDLSELELSDADADADAADDADHDEWPGSEHTADLLTASPAADEPVKERAVTPVPRLDADSNDETGSMERSAEPSAPMGAPATPPSIIDDEPYTSVRMIDRPPTTPPSWVGSPVSLVGAMVVISTFVLITATAVTSYRRSVAAGDGDAPASPSAIAPDGASTTVDHQRFNPSATSLGSATTGPSSTATPPSTVDPQAAVLEDGPRLCNSNYSGCVPDVSDVDCPNDGDGPLYSTEAAVVMGEDVYDLDTDNDGETCEPDQPRQTDLEVEQTP